MCNLSSKLLCEMESKALGGSKIKVILNFVIESIIDLVDSLVSRIGGAETVLSCS